MADLAPQVQQEISDALKADELELPVLPEIALNIQTEAEKPNVSVTSLTKVISEDVSISAQLIKVVNSPMFRTAQVINELPLAISRLGVDYSAKLATGLAMKHLFQATSTFIDTMLRKTWQHSTQVAGLSGLLAKEHSRLRVDQAMVAGLTHRIGVLPILSWAEENDHLLSNSITLERVVDGIHGPIGTMILQRWEFPEEVSLVPMQHLDHTRSVPEPDLITVVTAANRLLSADPEAPPLEEVTALQTLGIDGWSEEQYTELAQRSISGSPAL